MALPLLLLVAFAAVLAARRSSLFPDASVSPSVDPLADKWRRVAERPEDPQGWMELAEEQFELDQVAAAERSLWTAVELGDPAGVAHGRLGFLLYAQHRDAEALPLLEIAKRRNAEIPLLAHTLSVLQARLTDATPMGAASSESRRASLDAGLPVDVGPAEPLPRPGSSSDAGVPKRDAAVPTPVEPSAPTVGRGDREVASAGPSAAGDECQLALRRAEGGTTYLLDVDIGGAAASLIVDTGASLTVITRELARDLGIQPDAARSISAVTANGRVEMATVVLEEITVAGRRVEELRVAVCDDCVGELADGLLGLDLQTTLRMRLDPASGTLDFGDCDPL